MTDHDVVTLASNRAGVNIYLHKEFVRHCSADLAGATYAVHLIPGGGLAFVPVEKLRDYPFTIDAPPPELRSRVDELVPAPETDPFAQTDNQQSSSAQQPQSHD